jgi:ribosomal protein L22
MEGTKWLTANGRLMNVDDIQQDHARNILKYKLRDMSFELALLGKKYTRIIDTINCMDVDTARGIIKEYINDTRTLKKFFIRASQKKAEKRRLTTLTPRDFKRVKTVKICRRCRQLSYHA